MARIIVLDSGPLGLACARRGRPEVEAITSWRIHAAANGLMLAVPEIADYEVRRGLILAGAVGGQRRLDSLCRTLTYIPISTQAMRKAAVLWAEARRQGAPTAEDQSLDADVIVAAQALGFAGLGDRLTVATDNVRHLARYLDAREWEAIDPF